ncbi:Crp/Fnr family transcriptional regulator [Candidatus Aalborgicola defluviihabitans]|uniref:Crp/Fnr family transcriptional regulator n=1 Tax=Candidatus Aalborgicola defluviihabitans TaxID=3386187 RepID=UPI0039B99063
MIWPATAAPGPTAGTVLFSAQTACRGFPLVLEGEVKVSRHSSDGRSLELYRVVPGELCLASSASLFRSLPLSATGTATKPTTLLLIPPVLFNQWLETPPFAMPCWACLPSAWQT